MAWAETAVSPAFAQRAPMEGSGVTHARLVALCAVLSLHAGLLWWMASADSQARAHGAPFSDVVENKPVGRMQWITVAPRLDPRPGSTGAAATGPSRAEEGGGGSSPTPASGAYRPGRPPFPAAVRPPPGKNDEEASGQTSRGENASTRTVPAAPEEAPSTDTAPATARTPPLELRLPAGPRPGREGGAAGGDASIRGQALNDPRSNSRTPHALEEGIVNATTRNDHSDVEERGLGRRRVRGDGKCVDVRQARIAQIDAMNEVSARTMATVELCPR